MYAMIVEDVFPIVGRGIVITGKYNSLKHNIKANDYLYDCFGNHFLVKGIEMIRRNSTTSDSPDKMTIGLMIDINGKNCEYFIGKLLTDKYSIVFLFSQNPLNKNTCDFDYEEEFIEAEQLGCPTGLLDIDNIKPDLKQYDIITRIIYRGWMLTPENYRQLYDKLSQNSHYLINTPEQYNYCHLIPKWYDDFKDITPLTIWSEDISDESVLNMLESFGDKALIVKDYVKSRKHEWYEACYIPKASDKENAMKVIHTFLERQGENLIGGLVLREFVDLQFTGYHPQSGMKLSAEYRAFFLCGKLICIIDYWDTGVTEYRLNNDEYKWLSSLASRVNSTFFTIDIAREINGELIVMELGDGQVSGLQGWTAKQFYSKLAPIII